jgi:sigma-B regulation protein RsbU (phosphoserine phosphatase)
MMCEAGDHPGADGRENSSPAFSALLEDSAEDLYEHAPCGYLSTLLDGTIAKINTTLLGWLGYERDDVVGHRRFSDLLTVGGRLYHETHFAPLLRMQGELGGVAFEMKTATGTRLPVLVTSTLKTGTDGQAQLIRTTVFDASDRRAYERELLRARDEAERERDRVQRLARTLQQTLLPPALSEVPGMEVAAYYHPASADEVGGDFYDLFPLTEDTWGFFLGDVSGKGAAAAVVTSLARYTLRAAAVHDPDPTIALATLNTVLHVHVPAPPGRSAGRRAAQCALHRRRRASRTGRHDAALHRRAHRSPHARARPLQRRAAARRPDGLGADHRTGGDRGGDRPADRLRRRRRRRHRPAGAEHPAAGE